MAGTLEHTPLPGKAVQDPPGAPQFALTATDVQCRGPTFPDGGSSRPRSASPQSARGYAVEVRHIAVVNQSEQHARGDVEKATAAVQKQVTGDFGPAWDVAATVSVFSSSFSAWPAAPRAASPL